MFHPGKQTKKVTTIRLVPFHTLRITETPSNATDTLKSGAPSKSMLVLKVHGEKILFSRVHATLKPALSVGLSVGPSHFTFFITFISLSHF